MKSDILINILGCVIFLSTIVIDVSSSILFFYGGSVQWSLLSGLWLVLSIVVSSFSPFSTPENVSEGKTSSPLSRNPSSAKEVAEQPKNDLKTDCGSKKDSEKGFSDSSSSGVSGDQGIEGDVEEQPHEGIYWGGLLHRYACLISSQLKCSAPISSLQHTTLFCHLQQSFLQSVPQTVLQLYIIISEGAYNPLGIACVCASSLNLLWATIRANSFFRFSSNHRTSPDPLPLESLHTNPLESGYASRSSNTDCKPFQSAQSITEFRNFGMGHSKSLSLPTMGKPSHHHHNPGLYHSQNLLTQAILTQSSRPIKEHKFGSVITLKERSLLGVSNGVPLCGAPRTCTSPQNEDSKTKSNMLVTLLLVLGVLLLLGARVMGLVACALVLGPWIFMGTCVHLTVMFLLLVTKFHSGVFADTFKCLLVAAMNCVVFVTSSSSRTTWRAILVYTIITLENIACSLSFFLIFRSPTGTVILTSCLSATIAGLLFHAAYFYLQRKKKKEQNSNACVEHGCCRQLARRDDQWRIPMAETEDLSSEGSETLNCSSYATSQHQEQDQLDPNPPLLCSVQDLLANMSCLDDVPRNHTPLKESLAAKDSPDVIVELQDVVVDVSKPVRSAAILQSQSFRRDYKEYDYNPTHGQFRTSANYENYPANSHAMAGDLYSGRNDDVISEDSGKGSTSATPEAPYSFSKPPTPTSLERSVTREFDERLNFVHEVDVTENVSALEISSRSCLNESDISKGKWMMSHKDVESDYHCSPNNSSNQENRSDPSVIRTAYTDLELNAIPDHDFNTVGIPQMSPSSLYSSHNSSASTDIATTIESCRSSFHRPANSNVEFGVIKKLPSIQLTSPSQSVVAKTNHDYENVYSDNSHNSSNNSNEMTEKTENKYSSQNVSNSVISKAKQVLPLPLPPRTYIVRYPYVYVPKALISGPAPLNNSNHDYENIPCANIHRALLGMRHWKPYTDIESSSHDFSTFKEKSKINSTASYSMESENNSLKLPRPRPLSLVDDGESIISRSLPDLSNLVLETCVEVPEEGNDIINDNRAISKPDSDLPNNNRLLEMLNSLRSNRPARSTSVDDLSNYETIWVGEIESESGKLTQDSTEGTTKHSSLITTIGDVRKRGSLCNLYYSTMSDLSSRYYSDALRKSIAMNSSKASALFDRKPEKIIEEPAPEYQGSSHEANEIPETCGRLTDSQKNLRNIDLKLNPSELGQRQSEIASQDKENNLRTPCKTGTTDRTRRKFSMIKDKFETPIWTPLKSPLKFQSPAKALQVGMKVFNRPRVHTITPDGQPKESSSRKLTSPFKSKPKDTTPTIKVKMTENIEIKMTQRDSRNNEQILIKNTPFKEPHPLPSTIKAVQKTPKTSTPDNQRTRSASSDPSAPKHSTPEGSERHIPQISVISGLSSVVESPELSRISSIYGAIPPRRYLSTGSLNQKRIPFSDNIRPDKIVCKQPTMSALQEVDDGLDISTARVLAVNRNLYPFVQNPVTGNIARYGALGNYAHCKENVLLPPYLAYGGMSSQCSTLSPNSKIFDRKI